MPIGPPVRTILTSDDIGLGTYEMKVKGTYTLAGIEKYITSKFLFISPEEEQAFFDRNPEYKKKDAFLELNDPGNVKAINSTGERVNVPIRGRKAPPKAKDQIKDGILSEDGEIKHGQKPKVKTTNTKSKVAS